MPRDPKLQQQRLSGSGLKRGRIAVAQPLIEGHQAWHLLSGGGGIPHRMKTHRPLGERLPGDLCIAQQVDAVVTGVMDDMIKKQIFNHRLRPFEYLHEVEMPVEQQAGNSARLIAGSGDIKDRVDIDHAATRSRVCGADVN